MFIWCVVEEEGAAAETHRQAASSKYYSLTPVLDSQYHYLFLLY